jgi:hypothetical protein
MVDIHTLFEAIPLVSLRGEGDQFIATTLSEYSHLNIARDAKGNPSILISVIDQTAKADAPTIALEHLHIMFDVRCTVIRNNAPPAEGKFTVLRCVGQDRLMHKYFLSIVRLLFDLLPSIPTREQIHEVLRTLIELFRAVSISPKKSIQGLWAELLIIETSKHPETLVSAWHHNPFDRYDFNLGSERLEVKSTSRNSREHHFALDQLAIIDDAQVLVASLFAEPVNRGATVMDFAESIREKIATYPELVAHFDRVVVTTLGSHWRDAFEISFDKSLALSTLRFYDIRAIPNIPGPLHPAITNVRFNVDLSGCKAVDLKSFRHIGELYSALKRR